MSIIQKLFVPALASLLFTGCSTITANSKGVLGHQGQSETLKVSPKIASATGTVTALDSKNNTTLIDLKVKSLTPPQKINSSATTYVVWEKELNKQTPARSLGDLIINDKDATGSIETITALHHFEVFVTAEASPVVAAPSGDKLLSANINH